MIFDFHTHCYPDDMAQKAVSVFPKEAGEISFDGTLLGLKRFMRAHKLDYAIAMHIAGKPQYTVSVNNWAIKCKGDGVMSFGSVHPYYPDFKSEIARLKENGIKGLKFHPYYQGVDLCDPAAYRVYQEAAAQGMVMLFHTGLDILIAGDLGSSDRFARVVDDLKYDKIVAAHLGGSLTYDLAAKLVWGKNVYLDTSLSLRFLCADLAKKLTETHDPCKILFGSDGPWADPQADFATIDRLFGKADRQLIYNQNALNLLGIKTE